MREQKAPGPADRPWGRLFGGGRLRRAYADLRESEARYRTILQHVPVVSYVAEAGEKGVWTYVSPQIEQLLGFTQEEWLADPELWLNQIHPEDRDRVVRDELRMLGRGNGTKANDVIPLEYRMVRRDGGIVWVRDESVAVDDEHGRPSNQLRGVLVDVTERKALEHRLEHNALYDPVTGLANRALFTDRTRHALAGLERDGASVAVLLIDLDDFKAVNDTMGHQAGDHVLVAFAERLRACVRPADTVARIGGDEFAILLDETGAGQAVPVANRILESLRSPFQVDGRDLFVDAAIGIAETSDPQGGDVLIRRGDAAMYAAKSEGRGGYAIYQPEVHQNVIRKLELGTELRRAVRAKEFTLHYQPVVTLPLGRVVALEALVRWNHPGKGLVPPGDFLPVAEQSGIILSIDRWVLTEACRQARAWSTRFPTDPPLGMHVNMSARQLHHAEVVPIVGDAVAESGLDPDSLTLEITEGTLLLDTEATIEILANLRSLGIRLAIDDFGIGFSSLSYLRRLPVDVVKIDRSFVAGIATKAEDWTLARGIVRLLHGLGLDTVAEGIEQSEQVAHLRALGCTLGQGFYFARPGAEEDVTPVLARGVVGSKPA